MVAYQVTFETHPTYLRVDVVGQNTPETVLRYMGEVRAECMRVRRFNILIAVNLEGPSISMLDLYKTIATGSDSAVGLGMHVAYVDLNPAHSEANMLLAENVAMTRGIPVRTFRNVDDAREWLLAETAASAGTLPAAT